MPRPGIGNPGNKGGGRKGYQFELEQQKKMNEIVSSYFRLSDKIMKGKLLDENEMRAFNMLEKVFLKSVDKLHANKVHNEIDNPNETNAIKELNDKFSKMIEDAKV